MVLESQILGRPPKSVFAPERLRSFPQPAAGEPGMLPAAAVGRRTAKEFKGYPEYTDVYWVKSVIRCNRRAGVSLPSAGVPG